MATEGLVKRSIATNRTYESLPDRIKAALPVSEWNLRVKQHCIQQGLGWKQSLAKTICNEGEYYDDLVQFYTRNLRVFPYHMADYICRVMRVTPFQYNHDVLFSVMRAEKSYDSIPNFLAADILRLVGIGRNEYIATMNKGKAKKLMWRLNASSILRDILPTEPVDVQFQTWWIVNVVNLSEQEYKSLSDDESALCQKACKPEGLKVGQADSAVLQRLYKQGYIYLSVPIDLGNHVSIPPLEGFVSNKDSEKGEDKGDPMEAILYAMFVACSEKTPVSTLAEILSVEPVKLQAAISFACRLGFATCLPPSIEESLSTPRAAEADTTHQDSGLGPLQADFEGGQGAGIALVVDTEVTSYLMMGALSPGLKRHSVSLFEGGRITGAEIMEELVQELDGSAATAAQFEGEMQMLAGYARSLSCVLKFLQSSAQSRNVEILRKETLANLDLETAARVLSHSYAALLPITPLPLPPLPLSSTHTGPVDLGATIESSTPWLQLAFYRMADSSPHSFLMPAGQVFCRLPDQLKGCTHTLVWPWFPNSVRAQGLPIVLESKFLLHSLNEHLSCSPLLVQPVFLSNPSPAGKPRVVCLPLPLPERGKNEIVRGYDAGSGEAVDVEAPRGVAAAVNALQLENAVGCVSLTQVQSSTGRSSEKTADEWVVYRLQLGMPLRPDTLCAAICQEAKVKDILAEGALRNIREARKAMQRIVGETIRECTGSKDQSPNESAEFAKTLQFEVPSQNMYMRGAKIEVVDFSTFLQ